MENTTEVKIAQAQQLLDTLFNIRFDFIAAVYSFLPPDGRAVAMRLEGFEPDSFSPSHVESCHLSIHGLEVIRNDQVQRIPLDHLQLNELAFFLSELAGI